MKKHQSAIVVTILAIILLLLANQSKNDSAVDFDKRISELLLEVDTLNLELDEAFSSNERLQAEKKEMEDSLNKRLVTFITSDQLQAYKNTIEEFEKDLNLTKEQLHVSNKFIIKNNSKLGIYELNYYSNNLLITSFIDKGDSLEIDLNNLALELSEKHFLGLRINILEVKEVEGKNIAFIDLIEDDAFTKGNYAPSWYEYAQGSSGAGANADKLLNTFLQIDLDIPWIDGIKFTYEGSDVLSEHIDYLLTEIHYK